MSAGCILIIPISKLPIDVRLGKLVVLGHLLDVLEEAVIVAAGLSGKSIFSVPFEDKVNAIQFCREVSQC